MSRVTLIVVPLDPVGGNRQGSRRHGPRQRKARLVMTGVCSTTFRSVLHPFFASVLDKIQIVAIADHKCDIGFGLVENDGGLWVLGQRAGDGGFATQETQVGAAVTRHLTQVVCLHAIGFRLFKATYSRKGVF